MVLDLENFQVYYKSKPVLAGPLTIKQDEGQIIVVVGPSGVGKSSLLKGVLGLIQTHGTRSLNVEYSCLHVKNYFDLDETVLDNFITYYDLYNIPYSKVQVESSVNLREPNTLKKKAKECSYGTLRRLALYRTLYENKELVFLDEPTSGCDFQNIKKIGAILGSSNRSFFIVSHEPLITELADKLVVLSEVVAVLNNSSLSSMKEVGFLKVNFSSGNYYQSRYPLQILFKYEASDEVIFKVQSELVFTEILKTLEGVKASTWSQKPSVYDFLKVYHSWSLR